MAKGFYFDGTLCIGCRTCQVACKDKNDIEVGTLYRNVRSFEVGEFPNPVLYHYSGTCNHCAEAACVANCPTGAMYKADDGTTQHDDALCIGCQTCASTCPYGVPQYLAEKKIVGKCNACIELREEGGNPACVDSCPMRALDFGELDDLAAKYGSGLVSELSCLPSPDETSPALLIKARAGSTEGACELVEI